jgi:hypothetical protein
MRCIPTHVREGKCKTEASITMELPPYIFKYEDTGSGIKHLHNTMVEKSQ